MKVLIKLFSRNERGISLFETLIALVLTGTTLISLVLLASKSYKIVNITRVEDTTTQLADKALECAIAFRGQGGFSQQIGLNCLPIVNTGATPAGGTTTTTVTVRNQAGVDIQYDVAWGCNETDLPSPPPLSGTTRKVQTLQAKVTLNSANDDLKSTTGQPICALLESVIQESGPGGIYNTGTCATPLTPCQ